MVDALEDPRPRHTQFGLSSSIGVTDSLMSSSSSSLLYASNAFDVDVRAMKVVLDTLVELSDVTVEQRLEHGTSLCGSKVAFWGEDV